MQLPSELQLSTLPVRRDFVDKIWVAHLSPIRSLDSVDAATFLSLELRKLARLYGCRVEIQDFVLEGCVDLVMDQFSLLGLQEIGLAFQMAAAGRFDFELNLYGSFDAGILGKVLGAYVRERRGVLAGVSRALEVSENSELERRQLAARREAALALFPEQLEERRGKLKCWQDVPFHWYDLARDLGMISFEKGEAMAIYKEAKQLARREIHKDIKGLRGLLRAIELNALATGGRDDRVEALAKAYAQRMSVWQKLVLPFREVERNLESEALDRAA